MDKSFKVKISKIESRNIIKIPIDISKELPSRGMLMVNVNMNHISFIVPLEPDGKGSHWFEISHNLIKELELDINEIISLNIGLIDKWIEPEIPEDIINAIIGNNLLNYWNSLTTRARWEWLRWIRSTKNPETRKKRVNIACSKLARGDKRPCCFDATRCTIPELSKSGVLLD